MTTKKLSLSKKMALSGMTTALTVLCLYAASILPVGRIPLFFFAALVSCVLTSENAYGTALLSYIASSIVAFLIIVDKKPLYIYILLLGHYGVFRSFLIAHVKNKPLRILIKLLYCNIFFCLAAYLANLLLNGIPFELPVWLPVWAAVILLQAIMYVFDLLYGAAILIYQSILRRAIVPEN